MKWSPKEGIKGIQKSVNEGARHLLLLSSIEDFLDLSLVTSEWKPFLRDHFVKRLLTGDITANGNDFNDIIAYDFLLAELNNAHEAMSEGARMPIIPLLEEDGLDVEVVEGISELRRLKNEIHELELFGMVAGMVFYVHRQYNEFQKDGPLGIYKIMMDTMTKRIQQKGLEYFQKLEDLKKEGIVQKEGLLGYLGELLSLLPHKLKYYYGKRTNPDLLDINFWVWRASNSYWSIKGSNMQIKPIEYYDVFKPSIYDQVQIRHSEPMSKIMDYLKDV